MRPDPKNSYQLFASPLLFVVDQSITILWHHANTYYDVILTDFPHNDSKDWDIGHLPLSSNWLSLINYQVRFTAFSLASLWEIMLTHPHHHHHHHPSPNHPHHTPTPTTPPPHPHPPCCIYGSVNWVSIVQVMACYLFGAKALPEWCWLIVNWSLGNKLQSTLN